jgi:hypothetical protein
MNQLKFERDKQRSIKNLKTRIEMTKSGAMLEALEQELRQKERQTYTESSQERRFIVN